MIIKSKERRILKEHRVMLVTPYKQLCNLSEGLNDDNFILVIDNEIFTQNRIQIPAIKVILQLVIYSY